MSRVSASPNAIGEMAAHLHGRSSEMGALHAQVRGHRTAAASTGAHQAVGELMDRWAASLPHFGLAADRLMAAMHGAAAAYRDVDAATERAARDSERR